jgi:hypothetical protein
MVLSRERWSNPLASCFPLPQPAIRSSRNGALTGSLHQGNWQAPTPCHKLHDG